MFTRNTPLAYALMLIKSTGKKSWENLGTVIKRSGETARRLLYSVNAYFEIYDSIATETFKDKSQIALAVDVTYLLKMYSQNMQGSGYFYFAKLRGQFTGFKLLLASFTDGKTTIPFRYRFLFDKDLVETPQPSLTDLMKKLYDEARKIFPNTTIIIVVDGAFATVEFFKWANENGVAVETRMHSNRKVVYKEKAVCIRDIKCLIPRGRQMARTIKVTWYDVSLQLTAHRRIDKKGRETIVYQAATYIAKPAVHVKQYKFRWNIEKPTRTCKQHLGLADCFSTILEKHEQHVGAVFLAYALLQLEQRRKHHCNPEEALKAAKRKNYQFLIHSFTRRYGHLCPFYA